MRPYLQECGYSGALLQENYTYADQHQVPLVGFAYEAYDARNACIAAVDTNLRVVSDLRKLATTYRELGAPVLLICCATEVQWWSCRAQELKQEDTVSISELAAFFEKHRQEFSPESIYRAKTIGRLHSQQQLYFVDIGLMPLLEQEMGEKLADLIVRMINTLYKERGRPEMSDEMGRWLFQSAFWLLAAKILKDKGVWGFRNLDLEDVSDVLEKVKRHYNAEEEPDCSTQREKQAIHSAARVLNDFASLSNLTMESLAYVYENALVTKKTRKVMATHATPSYLVDYMVWQLAPWIEGIPPEKRVVLEPTCGHAPFLISAARLLREMIAEDDPVKRHEYLRKRLIGIERDGFAREVARLRLTLADVPNPNGWQLELGDVYRGNALSKAASKSTILLCNPPFQNFTPQEQASYNREPGQLHCFNKAAELLWRTLPCMPERSVFAVILPQGFLHSSSSAPLRKLILEQFELIEICALPENVFTAARHKSAVLLGRKVGAGERSDRRKCNTHFRHIRKWDLDQFKDHYGAVAEEVPQSNFYVAPNYDFRLQMLRNVWEYCKQFPCMRDVAKVGKGLEYRGRDLPQDAVAISERKFPGGVRGYARFTEGVRLAETPAAVYMSLDPLVIRRPGLGTQVGIPQILLNYARVSLGPWRLKALIDREGHPVTSSYLVVRPKTKDWSLEALWGLLNSPFANAYAYCNSMERLNLTGMIRTLPLPPCEVSSFDRLSNLVVKYFTLFSSQGEVLWSEVNGKLSEQQMLAIDAEVMRLYDLPPRLERQVLDFFAGWKRPGLQFDFWRYFPPEFDSWIPLHEYLSEEYQRSTVSFVRKWVEEVRSPEIIKALEKATEVFKEK